MPKKKGESAFEVARGVTLSRTLIPVLPPNYISRKSLFPLFDNGPGSTTVVIGPAGYGKTVTEYVDLATAIEAVAQKDADILLMSASPVVNGYKANREDTMIVWDPWVSSPIGMAVNKGNTELLSSANDFIDTFNDEDGLYDQLRANWDTIVLAQLERYGMDFYINEA